MNAGLVNGGLAEMERTLRFLSLGVKSLPELSCQSWTLTVRVAPLPWALQTGGLRLAGCAFLGWGAEPSLPPSALRLLSWCLIYLGEGDRERSRRRRREGKEGT